MTTKRDWKKICLIAIGSLFVGATVFGVGVLAGSGQFESNSSTDRPFFVNHKSEAFAARDRSNLEWAQKVIEGGYILHFRHAQRERWHDSSAFDAYELAKNINAETSSFSKATCLTAQGVEEAKLIGHVFRMAGVKSSAVYSSPSCRAWQTALHAFGSDYTKENALLNRSAIIPAQRDAFAKQLRSLLMGLEMKAGSNVILTGHGATLEWDGHLVIDQNNMTVRRDRLETGFIVLERKDGRIIAQYKFTSIKEFANALIELPVTRNNGN